MLKKIGSMVESGRVFSYKFFARNISNILEFPKDMDSGFRAVYNKCNAYTMSPIERMYALYKSVEYVTNAGIPGDFVECGVWRGGSCMIMANTLLKMKAANKNIYLYDTFTGMTKPTKEDVRIFDSSSSLKTWKKRQKKGYNKWAFSPLDEVKKNLHSTGYTKKNLVFVKGKVEDTLPSKIPKKISILRLDTDWYESTYHELNHLFPLLSRGGVLIIDDYGHFAGARKAVDEYFKKNKISILLNRIDYTCRLGIKP